MTEESQRRLLIVDDLEAFREVLKDYIEGLYFFDEIVECDSEAEAERLLRDEVFQVVILDVQMERPDSGLRVLRKLRDPRFAFTSRDANVIVWTIEDDRDKVAEIGRLDALYLGKGSSHSDLALLRRELQSPNPKQLRDPLMLARIPPEPISLDIRQRLSESTNFGAFPNTLSVDPILPEQVFLSISYRTGFKKAGAAVKKSVSTAGMKLVRADDNLEAHVLLSTVMKLIYTSSCVILDISDENPNVALEFGLAVAFGRRCLLIRRAGSKTISMLGGVQSHEYDPDHLKESIHKIVKDFIRPKG